MKNIVIGSGPAGRLASMQLGKLGEEVILIEKNHIAGTCLNEGCMVICALTDITKFIDMNKRFNNHGFLKSQIEVSYEKIVEKITATQKALRAIEQKENESVGNKVIFGEASIDGNEIKVNNESFEYDNLLIATGARPYIPDIKGSDYGLTNKDILKLDDVPEKLNIIGGGIIACEIANIYSTLGSEVNVLANEMMQTNVDNVYAAGDVTGGYKLTPVARMEGIAAARNMANYANKVSYHCIPQTLSLNMEVGFVENEKSECVEDDKATIGIPGIAGPGAFWNILTGDTGYTEIEFDKKNNKINKINSISPSAPSDIAYLSYLMREDYDLDDYGDFLEVHPTTDANFRTIKYMWL